MGERHMKETVFFRTAFELFDNEGKNVEQTRYLTLICFYITENDCSCSRKYFEFYF